MPIFSHGDAETVCRVVDAVAAGGVTVFEFTNRADHAIDVFRALAQHCQQDLLEQYVTKLVEVGAF